MQRDSEEMNAEQNALEIKESRSSILKQLRTANGLSRRETAEQSGINFRSLQDYEQGHKEIGSMKADSLYRLSLVLGCSMEELLQGQVPALEIECRDGAAETIRFERRMLSYYALQETGMILKAEAWKICSPEYKVQGSWKMESGEWKLVFCWRGEVVKLPFQVQFSSEMLPWLAEAAGLKMDCYIRSRRLEEQGMTAGGENWDES